jgi:two-component system, sensor histidine kinase and response regulator
MDPNYLSTIRVLVVEDDEDDWILLEKIFAKVEDVDFSVEWAPTYDKAIERIEQGAHDAYLIDYRLGEHTGTEILERVHPERLGQPFILMTGVSDSDLEWRSLRLAAADYLVKGSFDAMMLSRTITYALQRKYIEQQRIDQLVELNQAKQDFISIASHQLRTPATGVKQYLGMVVEGFVGDVPPAQLSLLKQAYNSNERQLRIIGDLLKVAQVDSGKMKLHFTEVSIERLLEEVIDEQQGVTSERNQTVALNRPNPSAPYVLCDRDAVRMVFENIIDNASKYSPEGSTIQIEVTQRDGTVSVSISDAGVGINEHDLPRLFEKFVRFENSLSTKVGGSGLGLYWAERIISMHGGRIDYRPNQPRGSVFSIVLPVQPNENSEVVHTTFVSR